MEAFTLTRETIRFFEPLLPEEFRLTEPEEGVVLLGVAETDPTGAHHACGTAALSLADEQTMLLHWLLVAPEYRRRGAGSAMLQLACELAGQMGMQILCVFSGEPESAGDDPQYRFFKKHGFAMEQRTSGSYSVSLEALGREAFFQREQTISGSVLTLAETPARLIETLNRTLEEQGLLLDGPITKEQTVGDVSLVYTEEETITACVIFREPGEGMVELSYAYSGRKASLQMPALLLRAQRLLSRRYGPETELVIPCVTDASRRLVEALVPSAVVKHRAYRAYWRPETAKA
jgi:N-acetylglutamate synthase-like GNAT family acetyltransferase